MKTLLLTLSMLIGSFAAHATTRQYFDQEKIVCHFWSVNEDGSTNCDDPRGEALWRTEDGASVLLRGPVLATDEQPINDSIGEAFCQSLGYHLMRSVDLDAEGPTYERWFLKFGIDLEVHELVVRHDYQQRIGPIIKSITCGFRN